MTLGFCGQTTPTKTNKIYETFKQKASDKCTKGARKKKIWSCFFCCSSWIVVVGKNPTVLFAWFMLMMHRAEQRDREWAGNMLPATNVARLWLRQQLWRWVGECLEYEWILLWWMINEWQACIDDVCTCVCMCVFVYVVCVWVWSNLLGCFFVFCFFIVWGVSQLF